MARENVSVEEQQALREIIVSAAVLYKNFPDTALSYQRAEALVGMRCQDLRDEGVENVTFHPHIEHCRSLADGAEIPCWDFYRSANRMVELVMLHLPETAIKLRILCRVNDHWWTEKDYDWEPLEIELRMIEIAAFNKLLRDESTGNAKKRKARTWQEVQSDLEALHRKGFAFTSMEQLSAMLFCSVSTVHKAIERSDKLTAWSLDKAVKSSPPAVAITAAIQDNLLSSEEDPSDLLTVEDADIILKQLIASLSPDEQQQVEELLKDMTPEQRCQFAQPYSESDDWRDLPLQRWRQI